MPRWSHQLSRSRQLSLGLLLVLLQGVSALLGSPVSAAEASAAQASSPRQRPNVLLLVADDAAFGDVPWGGGNAAMPNLESLAEEGVAFGSFHTSPVCSPTRASMLTGNDPIDVGLGAFDYAIYPPTKGRPGYEGYLTRNTVSVAELLRDAGYRTLMVGKWHLGGPGHGGWGPRDWGFERSYGILAGGANHWNQKVFLPSPNNPEHQQLMAQRILPDEPWYEDGQQVQRSVGLYSDDLFTSKLISYLEEGRGSGRPFFAYLAFTSPHSPLQVPPVLIERYIDYFYTHGYQGLKRLRYEAQKRSGLIAADAPFPDQSHNWLLQQWSALSEEQKQREARAMATYTAMLEYQDQSIGRVLNYLRETGQLENTLIIYLSDNGPEGMDTEGPGANPDLARWVSENFSQDPADLGRGNTFIEMGRNWANASNGVLQWWKWYLAEGGVRTPMVLRPPRGYDLSQRGGIRQAYVNVKDLPITILDYSRVPLPAGRYRDRTIVTPTGVSMRPYLEGRADAVRSEQQWVVSDIFGNSSIVAGRYKASRQSRAMFGDGQWRLFDIQADPGETQPLNASEPGRLTRLIGLYESYAKAKGIGPVADHWSPWQGYLKELPKPALAPLPVPLSR
ncbi:sulfatase-like hydrolase/transferase [Synechococcus sp. CCY9201]|uniref:sulfatase-like hydrolase/transferase n=1 Tax=Synechococcus sp. CCY9201 TaxID=174697 RepID=UPI002B20AFF3|nr:sulfatase-like hydrolase/transferase [Synechococcus sp. CCY9201]MEA5474054.1 sulfatase-like hydrolase/transferase [Synechococcus sp. CCY9201]